jgi:hypothetical protein
LEPESVLLFKVLDSIISVVNLNELILLFQKGLVRDQRKGGNANNKEGARFKWGMRIMRRGTKENGDNFI